MTLSRRDFVRKAVVGAGSVVVAGPALRALWLTQRELLPRAHADERSHDIPGAIRTLIEQATIHTRGDGSWSRASTWAEGRIPGPNDTVYIAGHTVDFDAADARVTHLINHGALTWIDGHTRLTIDQLINLPYSYIGVGYLDRPVRGFAVIAINTLPERDVVGGPFHPNDHGIWSLPNSYFEMEGQPQELPWTTLAAAARAGKAELVLDDLVEGHWRPGDQLLVTATGPTPTDWHSSRTLPPDDRELADWRQHEIAEIVAVSGNQVKLAQGLAFDHDARLCKVGNLTRTVVVHSVGAGRGHLHCMGAPWIRHCRFENLGVFPKMGRYPVHPHHPPERVEGWHHVVGNVVLHSGHHGIVWHKTSQFIVDKNIVFNVMGFAYYGELDHPRPPVGPHPDYGENIITGNLAVKPNAWLDPDIQTRFGRGGARPPTGDTVGTSRSTRFWLPYPHQTVQDNCGVDAQYAFTGSYVDEWGTYGALALSGTNPFQAFDGNVGTLCEDGFYTAYSDIRGSTLTRVAALRCHIGMTVYNYRHNEVYEDCVVSGSRASGVHVQPMVDRFLTFRRCRVTGTGQYGGFKLDTVPVDEEPDADLTGPPTLFEDCVLEDNPVDVFANSLTGPIGGRILKATFRRCTFRSPNPIGMGGVDITFDFHYALAYNPWNVILRFEDCAFPGASQYGKLGRIFEVRPWNMLPSDRPSETIAAGMESYFPGREWIAAEQRRLLGPRPDRRPPGYRTFYTAAPEIRSRRPVRDDLVPGFEALSGNPILIPD